MGANKENEAKIMTLRQALKIKIINDNIISPLHTHSKTYLV